MAMGTTEGTAAQVTQPGAVRVRRALLTVSDKRGLVDFAKGLAELGVEIVSTGGTARELESAGIETRPIDDYTGFPEILDGRVKTLNPRIYAGLLAVRSKPEHVATLGEQEIEPIDLVCVNLYPFERTAAARGVSTEEIVENIDIGGPTLIRAAAKNHAFAAVVTSPESYDAVIEEMRMTDGLLSEQTREALAMDAFGYTARYDAAIARWFAEREDDFPALYPRVYEKILDLPYGENPHQRAAYYAQANARTHLLSMVSKLHGKELSFNNLLDLDAARRVVDEFEIPAAVIVKQDRKSTRLNSSHANISYAVFCLKHKRAQGATFRPRAAPGPLSARADRGHTRYVAGRARAPCRAHPSHQGRHVVLCAAAPRRRGE